MKPIPYRVVWQIDIDANSPREAAELAKQIQIDPKSRADWFEVYDNRDGDVGNITNGFTNVDLDEERS